MKYILIVGTNDDAVRIARYFVSRPECGIRIVGFLTADSDLKGKKIDHFDIIGGIDDLNAIVDEKIVDGVFFADAAEGAGHARKIARRCEVEGLDFAFANKLLGEKGRPFVSECFAGLSVTSRKAIAQQPEKLFFKRLLDIAVSVFCIIFFIPFWVILPVLIKRDSPGSAIFSQERVGKNGRRFIMYKFRTMVTGAEEMQAELMHLNEMDGPVFKIENDPRHTRIGKWLRSTSLDEIPQVFNVLKGDMSLVGPRPPLYREVLQYSPWQRKRLSVPQGVTCLWQITGRNEIKFHEWVNLDLEYIENWSLILDLKIIFKTVSAVLSRRGAQ